MKRLYCLWELIRELHSEPLGYPVHEIRKVTLDFRHEWATKTLRATRSVLDAFEIYGDNLGALH